MRITQPHERFLDSLDYYYLLDLSISISDILLDL